MTTKADFDAEEWETIKRGPGLAGLWLIAADKGGTVRESLSMAKAYKAAIAQGKGTLLGEIAASPPDLGPPTASEDLENKALEAVKAAVSIMETKATRDEVYDYKRFCLDAAEHAAIGRKSGFLGIGGKRISDAESMALDTLAGTLGVERTPFPTE